MVQEINMTEKEQLDMYMKCSKKELCKMLIETNRLLKTIPVNAHSACNYYVTGMDTSSMCANCGEPKYLHQA